MKLSKLTAITFLSFILISIVGYSQSYNNYTLIVKNERMVSPTQYQFDIYMRANAVDDQSNLSRFQGCIRINGAFFNNVTASKTNHPANMSVSGSSPWMSYVPGSSEFGGSWTSFSYARYDGSKNVFSSPAGWPSGYDFIQIAANSAIRCSAPATTIMTTEKRLGTFQLNYDQGFNANVSPDLTFSTFPSLASSVAYNSSAGTPNRLTTSITVNNIASCGAVAGTYAPRSQSILSNVGGIGSITGFNTQVYPNPTTDKVTVKFMSKEDKDYTISVLDVNGKLVMEVGGKAVMGSNIHEIDLTNLAKASYMLKLQQGDASDMARIVLQ